MEPEGPNHLAKELAFQLQGRSVPILIAEGLPLPLRQVIPDGDGLELMLFLNRSLLQQVFEGTRFMSAIGAEVQRRYGSRAGSANAAELQSVGSTAKAWLDLIGGQDFEERLRGIDQDILGAYFIHERRFAIYWQAIGVIAARMEMSVEALTVVVLAHELVHAYTHLGFDIDRRNWPTERFCSTDIAIIEGLAQFYAEVVCRKLVEQLPEASRTFEDLISVQHPIYATHREWVFVGDESNGEIIRGALVECPWLRWTGTDRRSRGAEWGRRPRGQPNPIACGP